MLYRGWISISDIGVNKTYYLQVGVWYCTISPRYLNFLSDVRGIEIGKDGHIGGADNGTNISGVQFRIMLFLINAEGLLMMIIKEQMNNII